MNEENQVEIPYKFEPREYQKKFLWEVRKACRGESEKQFFYQIWHRRSGKDKSNIADVVPRRLFQDPALVKYIYPTLVMGRDNLWDGMGSEGFRYRDHIPQEIIIGQPNETRMTIRTKCRDGVGESLFQVAGTNKPDTLRGGNPKLFVFSEWADHDPYAFDVIEPIVRENKGIVIFNTTPKGDNHARALLEFAKGNPKWWVQTLTVEDTDVFSKEQMKYILEDTIKRFESNGRSADEARAYIEQEYYCSFDSPVIGSYYGALIMKAEDERRVTSVPVDLSVPVETAWDLGVDDSTTIWFFQKCGQEFHFVDYYENSGEGLAHYAQVLQEKKYYYGRHFAPHDIEVRELGSGKSRKEVAKSLGINFQTAQRLDVDDGINMVRTMFNQFWFDKDKCHRGLMAIKNYKKDWDEKNQVFRKQALHNWASHGADALRTFGVSYKQQYQQSGNINFGGVQPLIPGTLA